MFRGGVSSLQLIKVFQQIIFLSLQVSLVSHPDPVCLSVVYSSAVLDESDFPVKMTDKMDTVLQSYFR